MTCYMTTLIPHPQHPSLAGAHRLIGRCRETGADPMVREFPASPPSPSPKWRGERRVHIGLSSNMEVSISREHRVLPPMRAARGRVGEGADGPIIPPMRKSVDWRLLCASWNRPAPIPAFPRKRGKDA